MMRAKSILSSLFLSSLSFAAACGASQSDEPGASAAAEPAAPTPAQPEAAQPAAAPTGLEWFNPGCPFVRYSHGEGPLKDMARKQAANGVVWLAINSGAAGKQGAGDDVNRQARQEWSMEYPILIDADGKVGKAYEAKATPHMYVIDPNGSLVYRGALDNAPLGKVPSEGQVNYVQNALASVAAGKPVEVAETKAYGCSVKYAAE
jgi:hypothetical protein